MRRKSGQRRLLLPELVEPVAGSWVIRKTDIREAAVDTTNRTAEVPEAHTPAQRLARLHELGHVKYSPSPYQPAGTWDKQLASVLSQVGDLGDPERTYDPNAGLTILKMLEENRIDWLLWDRHGIDLRPAREVLDWKLMSEPGTVLQALSMCLQLAWTVWASRGLSSGVSNLPPTRSPDPETGTYFDTCWKYLCDENRPLAVAMTRGCLAMYDEPTDERRNRVAAELLTFFPLDKEPEPEQPPEKPAEKEEREHAEKEEREKDAYEKEQETGIGGEARLKAGVEYHDHTANIRRPTMRIARRLVPVSQGADFRFPHRYMLDKAIFAQRLLTEGGLMVDGSGSMTWSDEDMQMLMAVVPAIRVGIYHGFYPPASAKPASRDTAYARICTIAKNGRFATFTGRDQGYTPGNDADYEALQLLATWPKPRFWLSDGLVCGGVHRGPSTRFKSHGYMNEAWGHLFDLCDAFMKRHDILRVPDRETVHKLFKRQRVTLYRSCRPGHDFLLKAMIGAGLHPVGLDRYWPGGYQPQPVSFTL